MLIDNLGPKFPLTHPAAITLGTATSVTWQTWQRHPRRTRIRGSATYSSSSL